MQRFKFQASLMLMLSTLLATPSGIAAPPAQPAPLALLSNDIAMVEASSFSQSLALTGTLQPWQQTQLSAEIEAAVEDVYVRPGEAVKKGQVLLRFDLRDVKARLAAQQAQLDATKAQLDLAQIQLKFANDDTDLKSAFYWLNRAAANGSVVALQAVEEGGFFKRLWHSLLMWWQSV